jgi:2-polyprenyl-3-methyl-5-hydroxy-6-metoxy-1,4-benzoquinol methylase
LRKIEKKQIYGFSFLDAGCGMGEFAIGVAKRNSHAHVCGIDFTESNIPVANIMAQTFHLKNTKFMEGDLATSFTKSQYDLILCNSTLQFIKEDVRALENLHLALKPEGTLLLYVPIRYQRYFKLSEAVERKYLLNFFYKYHDDFLMNRYREEEVCSKLKQVGFNIQTSEYAYGLWGGLASEIYSLILMLVKELPIVVSFLVLVIYILFVFPIQVLLMAADYLLVKTEGNGLLLVLKKMEKAEKE